MRALPQEGRCAVGVVPPPRPSGRPSAGLPRAIPKTLSAPAAGRQSHGGQALPLAKTREKTPRLAFSLYYDAHVKFAAEALIITDTYNWAQWFFPGDLAMQKVFALLWVLMLLGLTGLDREDRRAPPQCLARGATDEPQHRGGGNAAQGLRRVHAVASACLR